jgi:5-methyltetrahydrofolate--homocysteine methyltransferase
MANLETLSQMVIGGLEDEVREETTALVAAGLNPVDIINSGLIAGMNVVGDRFKKGDMFFPEVLIAAKSMAVGIEIVRPLLADKDMPNKGTILLGTVKGDLHDIGKNLVGLMLESSGFKVIDLGIDISSENFVAAIKEHKPNIVGMAALLTTTMPNMGATIKLIREEGIKVKCIIGGAPVTQEFADTIGADGFAANASCAVDLCQELIDREKMGR